MGKAIKAFKRGLHGITDSKTLYALADWFVVAAVSEFDIPVELVPDLEIELLAIVGEKIKKGEEE